MKDGAVYSDDDFTAGESPRIIDLETDFGITVLSALLAVDGPGGIDFSVSRDGGTIYSDVFRYEAGDVTDSRIRSVTHLKLEHTGIDSAYRILVAASVDGTRIGRNLGTSPANPVYTLSISHGATRAVISDATETQLVSGAGILGTVIVGDTQNIDIWDHDGVSPPVGSSIASFKNVAPGVQTFNLPFENGLRIAGQMAKTFTVYYEG